MSPQKFTSGVLLALGIAACVAPAAAGEPQQERKEGEPEKAEGHKFEPFKPEAVTSNGSVTIGGRAMSYQANGR